MRILRLTGAAAAFLFFGAMVPVYGQHDDKHDDKQDRPDRSKGKQGKGAPPERTPEAKQEPERQPQPIRRQEQPSIQQRQPQRPPQAHQQHQPPVQPPRRAEQVREQPQRSEQQARAWQQQKGWLKQGGGWRGQETWQRGRAQRWSSDHRTWAQRGGYGGYYIPQDRFNLYFGDEHYFRLGSRPVIYQGYPRFEYSGTSFLLVDPYPEYWAENWYDLDEVYIDYDDGYYLYNRSYPQVKLAITIAL